MRRDRVRGLVALPVLGGLGALLVWAVTGLPGFGTFHGAYGALLNRIVVPARHTPNVVNAIVFDVRGLDTLGEEFILFASVLGTVLLLRSRGREEAEERRLDQTVDAVESDAQRVFGVLMIGIAFVVGLWLIAFGFQTPGGGFQGGVVVAGALVLLYAGVSFRAWHHLAREEGVDPLEGLGVGGYTVIGLAAVASGLPFLQELFARGTTGTLFSGGSLAYLNLTTAIEVAAANVVLCVEFLNQHALRVRTGR
jgi:multicomponent Na+:H+ antiporter subunit B